MTLPMEERRRHVRAKPTPALPAHVVRALTPGIAESLAIVDISVSGLAIALAAGATVGDRIELQLHLGASAYAIVGTVRWSSRGMVGLELVDPAPDTAKAVRAYVGDLLERGG